MRKINFYKSAVSICIIAVLWTILGTSCKKFLQVQPRDYIFEEEAFSSVKGTESALNGIYQLLADSLLYGNMLTLNATEQMAQYYAPAKSSLNSFAYYTYIDASVKTTLNAIWSQVYYQILGVNNFCTKLEDPSFNVITGEQRNIMLGEAYAIRAFLHFDLLRLFGPVYVKNPQNPSIPYYRKVAREAAPILPASTVISELVHDLDSALLLLKNDPIRTKGPDWSNVPEVGQSIDYLSNRQRRMNYFAVKTLLARVLLYAGKKSEAWSTIQPVIAEQEPFFPWSSEADYAKDPLLSKESFFGIENRNLYNNYRQLFSQLLTDDIIFAPTPGRLNALYAPTSSDLRLKYWFNPGVDGNKSYKVFVKFNNATVTDNTRLYYQPLIRKSELYLIAAETTPDLAQGYDFLNRLRTNKGLTPLSYQANSSYAELLARIQDEYQREFIGEGQTFFMFKRLNISVLPTFVDGTLTRYMTAGMYVPPLPENETYYR